MDRWKAFTNRITNVLQQADTARSAALFALAICLALTACVLGGRFDGGKLVYVVLVGGVAVVWHFLSSQSVQSSLPKGALGLLLAVVGLPLLQLVPMPTSLLDALVGSRATLLPIAETGWLSGLSSFSLARHSTMLAAALAMGHVTLFLAVYFLVKTRDDVRRVLAVIAGVTVCIAVVGVLQAALPNGKILWVYDYVFRRTSSIAQGPFTTPNHFGHFVSLGIGLVIYFVMRTMRTGPLAVDRRRQGAGLARARTLLGIAAAGLLICVLAVLMSHSRGALVALLVACGITILVVAKAGWISLRKVGFGSLMAVVVTIMAFSFGYGAPEHAGGRDLASVETWSDSNGRTGIWLANLKAIMASPWVGYGLGTHRHVYPAFIQQPAQVQFTHAESSYLQIATECGLLGVLVLLAALAMIAGWCKRALLAATDPDHLAMAGAIVAGLMVSLTQATVDFVWYIPACLAPAIVLAACVARLSTLSGSDQSQAIQEVPAASFRLAPGVCILAIALSATCLYPASKGAASWDRYQQANHALELIGNRQLDSTDAQAQHRLLEERDYYLAEMVAQLSHALEKNPSDAPAHARLASRALQRFELSRLQAENSMSLPAIRQAALASEFPNAQQLRTWLQNACGKQVSLLFAARYHAQQAVMLNPLLSEGYATLAQLDFLNPQQPDAEQLIAQAMQLDPHDGALYYQLGIRRQMDGDFESWRQAWRTAMTLPGAHRQRMLAQMACCIPAEVLLSEFPIDWQLIRYANRTYQRMGDQPSLRHLATFAMQQLEQSTEPAERAELAFRWRQVSAMLLALEENEQATHCARQACQHAPHEFHARFALAHALVVQGNYKEADPHLRWCTARRPDIVCLQNWLRESAKQRLQQAAQGPPAFADANRMAFRTRTTFTHSRTTGEAQQRPAEAK